MKPALLLAVLLLAAPARADDPPPTPAQIREGTKHFETGKRLIQQKKFDEAIVELEAAYQTDPRTDHLYNLGVAHQLDGHDEIAIEYYRLYLIDNPTGKAARDAAKYLAGLEAKRAEAKAERDKQALAELRVKVADAAADTAKLTAVEGELAAADKRAAELADEKARLVRDEAAARKQAADNANASQRAHLVARRWERSAREASSGAGRTPRVLGALLLSASAGAFTWGALNLVNGQNGGIDAGNADPEFIAGTATLALGFSLYVYGELQVHTPRDRATFQDLHVTPAVGPHATALTLSTRF